MGNAIAQSSDKERRLRAAVRSEKKADAQFLKLIELGNYYKTHNLKRADSIREVLTTRSAKLNESFRIRALLFSAEVNELRGNQDAYYRDVLACLPYLSKNQPIDLGFMINRQLGYYYCSTLNFKKADQYLRAAELIVRSARKYGDVAITNNYLALNFMYQNQKDSAIRYTNKAIQFARRTSDKQALTMCFNTQARIYDYFGQVELSVAKNINAVSQRAHDAGLKCSYHPNSPPASLVRTQEDYDVVLSSLDPKVTGWTPDVGHIIRGGMDVIATLNKWQHLVNHIHYKDFSGNGAEPWAQMGTGKLDFHKITEWLVARNYSGWIICEDEAHCAVDDPDGVTKQNGEWCKANLHPIVA